MGSRLVDLIRRNWKEELHEGRDYEVLKGKDLKDFFDAAPNYGEENPISSVDYDVLKRYFMIAYQSFTVVGSAP